MQKDSEVCKSWDRAHLLLYFIWKHRHWLQIRHDRQRQRASPGYKAFAHQQPLFQILHSRLALMLDSPHWTCCSITSQFRYHKSRQNTSKRLWSTHVWCSLIRVDNQYSWAFYYMYMSNVKVGLCRCKAWQNCKILLVSDGIMMSTPCHSLPCHLQLVQRHYTYTSSTLVSIIHVEECARSHNTARRACRMCWPDKDNDLGPIWGIRVWSLEWFPQAHLSVPNLQKLGQDCLSLKLQAAKTATPRFLQWTWCYQIWKSALDDFDLPHISHDLSAMRCFVANALACWHHR